MTASGPSATIDTVVVGLDGAGFDLLEPWLDSGELPTLSSIVTDGVSGPLESVLPPVTSPNWKAYATGKNPGKIGVFWWQNVDTDDGRTYLPRERYHHSDEFWELIAEDEPVGVVGVPTTYPPKEVDRFLVAGPPDAHETGYAHPSSLEDDLEREFDYRHSPRTHTREDAERAYEEWLELVDLRFEVATALAERHDVSFLQVTTFLINQFHHHLWDDERTLRAWKHVDDHLADLRSDARNVVLMSDHGHNEIRSVFRINQWFEREGYLAWDRTVSRLLYGMGVNMGRVRRLLKRANRNVPGAELMEVVRTLAPRAVLRHLPDEQGEVGTRQATNVNWEHTDALASAQGPIYLNADPDSPRYDALREELKSELESLTDPRGRPVADTVHYGEDVYAGPYVEEGPDLVIDQHEGIHIRDTLGDEPVFSETDPIWNGVNRREGLFAALGPDFASGTVEDLSILDLAPTMLALHDRPIPADVDGRVRTEVLADEVGARVEEE